MAEWRAFRGWTETELERRLAGLSRCVPNVESCRPADLLARGYESHASEAAIGREPPGRPVPDGAFARARAAIRHYDFSDPRIVTAHFDAEAPLAGRRMLLEIKVLGLRFLCGVVVGDVVAREAEDESAFLFRYETLQGHIERGCEWFVLTKCHQTGVVTFRIAALWRRGDLPTWWSRAGFAVLARRYQENWHRLAYVRLRRVAGSGREMLTPLPRRGRLVHAGAALPDAASPWRFPEVSRGSPVVHPHTRRACLGALGYGVMTGVRSMSALPFLSHDGARRAVPWLAAAALGETVADKTGLLPARTRPLPLAGRVGIGAACGAAVATMPRGGGPLLSGLLGAGAAAAAAFASTALRRRITARRRVPDVAAGLLEDVFVLALGMALGRARAVRESRRTLT